VNNGEWLADLRLSNNVAVGTFSMTGKFIPKLTCRKYLLMVTPASDANDSNNNNSNVAT
jgi:hypothetical protein